MIFFPVTFGEVEHFHSRDLQDILLLYAVKKEIRKHWLTRRLVTVFLLVLDSSELLLKFAHS